MSHICDIWPLCSLECVPSITMHSKYVQLASGISTWKWFKNGFFGRPLDQIMSTGGILKGGCLLVNGGSKGAVPPHCPRNLVGSWDISFAVKPDIVGVAGANMQFCLPQLQSKKNTAFEIVQWSDWILSSPSKQVGRCSTPCWKRSQVWGRGSERWPKYMQQRHQCWKWEEFWKTSSVL